MFRSERSKGLPDELVLLIFSYFDLNDVPSLASVNKQFNAMIHEQKLWQMKFRDKYPQLYKSISQQNNINWFKEYYKAYKEANVLIEFLNLLNDLQQKSSQVLGLSSSRFYTAAAALKRVLFDDSDKSLLNRYSVELSNTNFPLGQIYNKLTSLNLIDHAKKYYLDLIGTGTGEAYKNTVQMKINN